MKYSIIRVLQVKNGQDCAEEFNVDNKIEANKIAEELNMGYGTKHLKWVVDAYKVTK